MPRNDSRRNNATSSSWQMIASWNRIRYLSVQIASNMPPHPAVCKQKGVHNYPNQVSPNRDE